MGMDSPSGRRGNPMSPSPFKRSLSVLDISWRSLGHRHKFLLTMLGLLTLLCTVYLYFAVTLGTNDSCSGLGGAQRVRCQLHANTLNSESRKAHHRRLLYVEDADSSEQEPVIHSGGSKKDLLEFLMSWHNSIKDKEESEITRLKRVITSLNWTITSLHRSNARLRKTVTALQKEHHTISGDDDAIPVPPTTTSKTRRAARLRGDI
ncbi:hypothetical protein KC19_2G153500 [Ceratodon purpureus]|uniref:Uncharacterized protein n=1 Tax=Ceratodon purpureus TaxID=3225 RepID=A0A8T0IX68_CERPU|nr:hypothetical protein KC19_2G153500 [Ceratodon purpureus]